MKFLKIILVNLSSKEIQIFSHMLYKLKISLRFVIDAIKFWNSFSSRLPSLLSSNRFQENISIFWLKSLNTCNSFTHKKKKRNHVLTFLDFAFSSVSIALPYFNFLYLFWGPMLSNIFAIEKK